VDDGPPPGGFPMPDYASQWDAFTPCEILPLLRDVGVRWYVAAGWAVDLFVGRRTREHEDLEIAVPAEDFPRLRPALPQFEFVIPSPDRYWPVDDAAAFAWSHQTWARDEHGRYRFDVFREPWDGETWMCGRDPSIRRVLPRDRPADGSGDSVPGARGRAPVQGEAGPPTGRGRPGHRASPARPAGPDLAHARPRTGSPRPPMAQTPALKDR
jgi:Aminoglycoside-2''-adenylyltransferase